MRGELGPEQSGWLATDLWAEWDSASYGEDLKLQKRGGEVFNNMRKRHKERGGHLRPTRFSRTKARSRVHDQHRKKTIRGDFGGVQKQEGDLGRDRRAVGRETTSFIGIKKSELQDRVIASY